MNLFGSDNQSGACDEVMQAVIAANHGIEASYGDDALSMQLTARMSELFEKDVAVFPVLSGTAANALALSAVTPSFGKVFCHELAHINTDECAAPELFTGGAKLIALPGADGRIGVDTLTTAIRGRGNVHLAQPATVSITQACEAGTLYTLEEIAAIGDTARSHGLTLHMDGARFANAVAALAVSPARLTWQSGVDALSFGATKNGCLAAEAVVFFDPSTAGNFRYLRKRAGQLLSKMRYVSAQLLAYVSDDLWLRNARHANAMAARLSQHLVKLPGVELAYPTQSNEVFVRMARVDIERLHGAGIMVNDEELDGSAVRFVTAWNTDPADIDRLVAAVRGCLG